MNPVILWQVFLISIIAAASPVAASECRIFVHESNPAVTVEDTVKTIIVKEGEDVATYDVVIDKYFGQLMSVAYDADGVPLPYRYLEVDGRRLLILQSAVFYPTCK